MHAKDLASGSKNANGTAAVHGCVVAVGTVGCTSVSRGLGSDASVCLLACRVPRTRMRTGRTHASAQARRPCRFLRERDGDLLPDVRESRKSGIKRRAPGVDSGPWDNAPPKAAAPSGGTPVSCYALASDQGALPSLSGVRLSEHLLPALAPGKGIPDRCPSNGRACRTPHGTPPG